MIEQNVNLLLRRHDGLGLNLGLLRQNAQRRKLVLDPLKRGQHSLPGDWRRSDRRSPAPHRPWRCSGRRRKSVLRPGYADVPDFIGERDGERTTPGEAEETGEADVSIITATATPIRAFSCCIARSAAAMSGRRSSRVEGRLTGIDGRTYLNATGVIVSSGRRFADQHGDRMFVLRAADARVDRLRLRVQELRFRGGDVRLRDRARRILVLRDRERSLVLFCCLVEEVLQGIEHSRRLK